VSEVIARGGTCTVSRRLEPDGNLVAEKRLLPKYQGRVLYESLLRREYDIMSQLSHKSVPRAHRLESEKGSQVYVLDWCQGNHLGQVSSALSVITRSERQAWSLHLYSQMRDSLNYIHSQNLIHGDICLENFILNKDGVLKLIDFGVARWSFENSPTQLQVRGRPKYRAPELLNDGATSLEGDIFAVGKVFEDLLGSEAEEADLRAMVETMTLEREFLPGDFPAPSIPLIFDEAQAEVIDKTVVGVSQRNTERFQKLGAVLSMLFFLSLSPVSELELNSLPSSSVELSRVGSGEVWQLETPVLQLKLMSGKYDLEMRLPHQDKPITHILSLSHGKRLKLFEDFRKVDSLRR